MSADSTSTLTTSLLADQRARWDRGEQVSVEEFLRHRPDLKDNTELVLDLIYSELILRRENGEDPPADEYIKRFPNLAADIRTQFELDAAIDVEGTQIADPEYFVRHIEVPAPTQVGRFKIMRELGRGGFGVVYLAYDPQLGRYVAVKVPRSDIVESENLRTRFQQEARAAAVLDHPNLVPVYEAGEVDSICYIVSAYCPGINLAHWIRTRTEPVPFADAARLICSLCDGVQHSHAKGILHRDLKPANVMLVAEVSETNGEVTGFQHAVLNAYQPKITDFGLAKLSGGEAHTVTGAAMGTPAYMAPEQALGSKTTVGPTTDVYSLGVMLYELLTGRTPFVADSPVEVLLAVQKEEPVPPSRLRQRLPRDLETICLKCLEKEPHRRYASAEALGEDLGRFLAGDSILARPVGAMGRTARWARRHRGTAALLAGLAFTLALGIAGIAWQWWRADQHAEQAGHERDVAQQARKSEAQSLDRHRIMRAYDEWLSDNTQGARELLQVSAARKDTWEYRYVERLCNTGMHAFEDHNAWIAGAAFNHDGTKLISADREGVLIIRDLQNGTSESFAILPDQSQTVSRMAVHPDGRHIAALTFSGLVHIWDKDKQAISASWVAHDAGYYLPMTYSPGGRFLATASGASVKVWDAATNEEIYSFKNTHRVTDLAWSPDDRFLAVSAHGMNLARIWEVATGKEIKIPTVQWMTTAVAFSPDGRRFAWAGMDGLVSIHDINADFKLLTTLAGSPGYQSCLVFSPDGRTVVAGARNGPARVWRVETGQLVSTIHGHSSGIRDVAFSPDTSLMATVGSDRRIIVRDNMDYQEVTSLIAFSPWQLNAAAFSSDGRMMVAATNYFRLWDVERRSSKFTSSPSSTVAAISVAFHPNDQKFAGGDSLGKIHVYDLSGKEIASRQMSGFPLAMKYVDGGSRLLIAGCDNALSSWNSNSADKPERIIETLGIAKRRRPWPDDCRAAFSPAGDMLVYTERNQPTTIWDTKTGQKILTMDKAPDGILTFAFNHQKTALAMGTRKGEIQIRDLQNGELIAKLVGHPQDITGLGFTPDGLRLASVAGDGVVKLWDAVAAVEVLSLRDHATYDTALAFSPDGERCLVGGWDGYLRMWSIRDPNSITPEIRLDQRRAWHTAIADEAFTARRHFIAAHHYGELMKLDRDRWQLRLRRGWAYASLGDWKQAADHFEEAIAHPNCGIEPYINRAYLHLRSGELEAYQDLCKVALKKFESATEPATTNSLIWMCCLHPSATDSVSKLVDRAKAALAKANATEREDLINTVGAALFRTGKVEESIKYFDESVKYQGTGGYFEDWLFLALAHFKQGHQDVAKDYFLKATFSLPKLSDGETLSDGRKVDWRIRVEIQTLYDEVKKTLSGGVKK